MFQGLSVLLPGAGVKRAVSWDMKNLCSKPSEDVSDYMEPLVQANEHPKYLELIDSPARGESWGATGGAGATGNSHSKKVSSPRSPPPADTKLSYTKLDTMEDGDETETSELGGSGPPSERNSAHLPSSLGVSIPGQSESSPACHRDHSPCSMPSHSPPIPPLNYIQVATSDDDSPGAANTTDSSKLLKCKGGGGGSSSLRPKLNYAQLASSVPDSDIDTDNEAVYSSSKSPSPHPPTFFQSASPTHRPKATPTNAMGPPQPWGRNNNCHSNGVKGAESQGQPARSPVEAKAAAGSRPLNGVSVNTNNKWAGGDSSVC